MKSSRHTAYPIRSAHWLSAGRWCLPWLLFFFFLLHTSPTIGQTREQLTGTWIGVHTEIAADATCPLPTYIQVDADSTYRLGMVDGSATARTATWSVNSQHIRLDTVHFDPKAISVTNDLLHIGTNFPILFRRFVDVPIDSASAYRQLSGRVWQSGNLTIHLYTNGQVSLENPVTKQRSTHFWQLARFRQSVFLVIMGNQFNRRGGYKPLWQITGLSSGQLQAVGWNGCDVATETFSLARHLSNQELPAPTEFQLCNNCFQAMWSQVRLSHNARQYELNRILAKQYRPVRQRDQTGLLTIQFVVNCAGQSGLYVVNGFGDDYCPKTFDCQLTEQLLSICRSQIASQSFLHPGSDPGEQFHDAAVSLTFRLKDGAITDMLP